MILESGLIDTLLKVDLVAANKHLFVGYDMSEEEKRLLIAILVSLQESKDKCVYIKKSSGKCFSEKSISSDIAPMRRKHMLFNLEGLVELGVLQYRLVSVGEEGEEYAVIFKGGMNYV